MAHHQIVVLGFVRRTGASSAVCWVNGRVHYVPLYQHPGGKGWALNEAELLEKLDSAAPAVIEVLRYQVHRDPIPVPGDADEQAWWEDEHRRMEPTLNALRAEPDADFARVARIAEAHAGMADTVEFKASWDRVQL